MPEVAVDADPPDADDVSEAADADADAADLDVSEVSDDAAGREIVTVALVATAAFTAAALLATVFPDQLAVPVAWFDGLLFAAGLVAFGLAFVRAVGRSRTEHIEIASLFFLAGGSAPTEVRRSLLGAFALQIVVALVTSSIRLYTEVAFGVLVPMMGLGLAGLWGARHGRFPARPG